ncbi:MAG: hypothetical protein AAB486_00760 [Patescibacteria group bacterium]
MSRQKRELLPYQKREKIAPGSSGRNGQFITVGLVVIFICLQVVITNLFSGNGSELRDLESKKLSLEKTNEQFRGELAALGSLTRIQSAAVNNLKMTTSTDRLDYLVPSQYSAASGKVPTPATIAVRQ